MSIDRSPTNCTAISYKRLGGGFPNPVSQGFVEAYVSLAGVETDHHAGKKVHLADPSGMWKVDATVVDSVPDHPLPDGEPSRSFWVQGKKLVVVVDKDLCAHLLPTDKVSERDEAILHELHEILFLQQLCLVEGYFSHFHSMPPKLMRIAHIAATARMVKQFAEGHILPLHRRDIGMMPVAKAEALLFENREDQHALLSQYFPGLVTVLSAYERDVMRPALSHRVAHSTQPLVLPTPQPRLERR